MISEDRFFSLKKSILLILVLTLMQSSNHADEENDLWLLISSYEDIGISVIDLAVFLSAHGYDAKPNGNYVTVTFSNSKEIYLTPNGGSPRLADMWMVPPEKPAGPIKLGHVESIKKNEIYVMSTNQEFKKVIARSVLFPLVPLGMCYDGSKQLGITYTGLGYNLIYMFDPIDQGHEWVLVEDDSTNTWLALDSYYGVMTDDDYYTAAYSFPKFELLDMVNPQWRTS